MQIKSNLLFNLSKYEFLNAAAKYDALHISEIKDNENDVQKVINIIVN